MEKTEDAVVSQAVVWVAVIAVMLAGLAMFAVPKLKRAYDRRSASAAVRRSTDRAKEAAAALASAPGATFQDRLAQLAVLQKMKDAELSPMLAALREGALAKPEELYQLLSWMNGHDLVLLVVEWLRELPREVLAKPPVCLAVAGARTRAKDWETLRREVEIGKWGVNEFYAARLRSARAGAAE